MLEVPPSTHDITADWLTDALTTSGYLTSSVQDVRIETIGAGVGLMGELGRLHLTYAGEEQLPATIVAKCAAQNENREVARILDFYNREADFYNRVAADCPLRIPASYYADVKQDSYDFVLLMEDLGDVSLRDQLIGASRDEVFSAVGKIAELHARWWATDRSEHEWMFDMMSITEGERLRDLLYGPGLAPTIDNFSYLLNDQTRRVLENVGERYVEFWSHIKAPDTFVHGDYRQDNMLYSDGHDDALVMDWQISGCGKSIFDVAYFMCQSVDTVLRREVEEELLEFYVRSLGNLGVTYPLDDCREDYRRIILGCLVYPVTVCGTLDTANERGKALGESMLTRNLAAIEDLDCLALL